MVLYSGNKIFKTRSMLKKYISKKDTQNYHKELNTLDELPLAQIHSIREGFKLQKELGIKATIIL